MSQPEMILPPEIDRISALPDEMLIHILSFLPTKSAFTTTVLSKRWKPLFHWLTAFYFDDERVRGKEARRSFSHFVDKVLLSPHVQHHPVKTFCLMCGCPGCKVDEWIQAMIRRGVENLDLTASPYTLLLWSSIFTSQTLVVLKLNGFYMELGDFESIDVPSLKTLHLTNTYFIKRKDFKKLLSVCPNLVDLYAPVGFLNDRYNENTGYKNLTKLEKACIYAFDVPFSTVYNVEFLRIEMMERRCSDKYMDSYYREMPVFHNLISIELCWGCFSGWAGVVEVLSYCPKLQTLAIEKHRHDQIYNDKWEKPVPECVSLHLTTCSIGNYQIHGTYGVDDFKFAAYIMQNAKLLQVMTLHIDHDSEESEKDRFLKHLSVRPRISPACKIECKYRS
ncbi:FBD-associated F-box protein At4g10400-like [Lotus japonicus]|uniref:FBD-associated F-box protein At4g10400-like n=1 Tax=Lotus japonicus TaxID=34305 RepID=UPI00258869F1|nr:FBD-associated F-box protein At4g10400-like [Lotus japonicus]